MTPIVHNFSSLAGTSNYWVFSDTQEMFDQNCADPTRRAQLEQLGYLDQSIVYRFNSHGFRGAEFPEKVDVVAFGCSFTMGSGILEEQTWPSQLSQMSGLSVVNLGHAGSSNDTSLRFADYYLPKLSPQYAVWVQTDSHRIELIDQSCNRAVNLHHSSEDNLCKNDYFVKVWFSSFENHRMNLLKNTLAFKQLCQNLNIVPIIIPRTQVLFEDVARDLNHPGPASNLKLASQIYDKINQSTISVPGQ